MSYLLTPVVALIGPVVALILVLVRAQGQRRLLGVLGSAALIVSALAQSVISLLLPRLMRQLDLPARSVGLLLVPGQLLAIAGIILLAVAVGTADRTRPPLMPPR